MKILVCGGRDFQSFKRVDEVLSEIKPTAIVHGAANGAERWPVSGQG